jgi:phosphoribosyl-AMP cyclohydrolase
MKAAQLDGLRPTTNTRNSFPLPQRPTDAMDWLDEVRWSPDGLVAAIAQDSVTGKVLTLAWMNRDALERTVETGEAHYWSRSRARLWRKGESSGHVQRVREVRLDCDSDAILLAVEQTGGIACHTGRERCFFKRLEEGRWVSVDPIVKDPREIYGHE